jgi:hypothetical protein
MTGAIRNLLYRRRGDGTYESTGLTEEYVEGLEKALGKIAQPQGEVIPVYNDEFVRVSWIHEILDSLIRSVLSV